MIEKVQQEVVKAMKSHDTERTGTLRLIVNSLKNKEKGQGHHLI
jgi:uncharacterized protein YqeY